MSGPSVTGRGGKRTGKPGGMYPNRSDLRQPVAAGPSTEYGSQTQQLDAQRQIALPASPTVTASAPVAAPAAPTVLPGSLGAIDRPTTRPDEPVTAGADVGPGPGSSVLGLPQAPDTLGALLRQMSSGSTAAQFLSNYFDSGHA